MRNVHMNAKISSVMTMIHMMPLLEEISYSNAHGQVTNAPSAIALETPQK
jgi:hypothetical protein